MRTLAWTSLFAGVLCLTGCHRDPAAAKQRYMESGDQYVAQGKLAEAVIEYRNAAEQMPNAADVRAKLADVLLRVGDRAGALQEYIRAADLQPQDESLQLKTGALLLLGGRFADAKARAEKVLAANAKSVAGQVLLANALAGLKDFETAVGELEEAIRLEPGRSATYSNLGAFQLAQGHKDEAERAFMQAVSIDPKSVSAHLALANFYWADGRFADAERELSATIAIAPDNALAHRALANLFLATRRPELAEAPLKKVAELTKTPQAALALADYYVGRKRGADARRILQPLADQPATATAANVRLAALDHLDGRTQEAYARVAAVLKQDAGNVQALLLQGTLLLGDGKRDEALTVVNQALKAHPDSAPAWFALGQIQTARQDTQAAIDAYQRALKQNPRATQAKLAIARLQLASGRTEESLDYAQEAVAAEPANPDARLTLVAALLSQNDLVRAESELNALRARYPDSAPVLIQTGMLLGRKRDLDGARKAFERAMQLSPGSLEAAAGLVALDLSTRRLDAARARVDALASDRTARPAALMLAGRTYATLGDFAAAEAALRRILSADPSYLPAYRTLGQLYVAQHKLPEALAEFEALAKRDPKPTAPLTLAAMILQAQGRTADARQRYERILQLDPEAAVAANNLAWLYVDGGGDLDAALQLAQTAKRRLPNSPEVNDTLGLIYYRKNLPAMAIPPLKLSAEKDPANAEYHYHLGMAYAKNGDEALARQALQRALSSKGFERAADAKALLDSLDGER